MRYVRILLLVVLTGSASTAFAQNASTKRESAVSRPCTEASLSGTYGFLHSGTDRAGQPTTTVTQITFDPTTATFNTVDISSHNGVITPESFTGTYAVASNCTAENKFSIGGGISFVVTSTGFFAGSGPHQGVTVDGFGVAQGSPTCTNAGVEGSFGFEATGVFLAGAPVTGPVVMIGELKLSVDTSGAGVISGHVAGSEDGTLFTFAGEPVIGTYSVAPDCTGTATITPKNKPALNFSFVVVNGGTEMLAIETDADTVVSATLQQ
jgi:hypothetical protein